MVKQIFAAFVSSWCKQAQVWTLLRMRRGDQRRYDFIATRTLPFSTSTHTIYEKLPTQPFLGKFSSSGTVISTKTPSDACSSASRARV
ncbi:hypothetical protein BJX63DRAFT_219605 [Aspergillus granulosus]|uniref:Secreted protein n=1 Tax=Aspergillus granulosus TaxID=176169 RepID=A0ABR4I1F5_9EURO